MFCLSHSKNSKTIIKIFPSFLARVFVLYILSLFVERKKNVEKLYTHNLYKMYHVSKCMQYVCAFIRAYVPCIVVPYFFLVVVVSKMLIFCHSHSTKILYDIFTDKEVNEL